MPVSTTETAGPGVSGSEQGLQPGNSREGSLGAIGSRGHTDQSQSSKLEVLPPCWEPCLLRRVEGPRKLSVPVWAARGLGSVRGATRPLAEKQDSRVGHSFSQEQPALAACSALQPPRASRRIGGRVYPSWTSTPPAQGVAVEENEGKRAGQRQPWSGRQEWAGWQRAGRRASVLPGAQAGYADSLFSIWK